MVGEPSGVLDSDDVNEPSLDDWLAAEHVAQVGESIGTDTVSGTRGDLGLRAGVKHDIIIGLVHDVIIFVTGGVGVEKICADTPETVAIVTAGHNNRGDVTDDEVVFKRIDDVIGNDATADEHTVDTIDEE